MQKSFKIWFPFRSFEITFRFKSVSNNKRKAYNEHLRSKQWFEFKASVIKDRGFKCELCKSQKDLELHHLSYKRFGNEQAKDVMLLCHKCHLKAHKK